MRLRGFAAVVVSLSVILVATACSSPTAPTGGAAAAVSTAGGTLYVLRSGRVGAWDPQRLDLAADMAFAGRVFQRTLTAWAPATGQGKMPPLAPDLATDTGKVTSGGRVWTFTLRPDATWQDGKPVTCADVKYGISRTYATTQITGGLAYALDFLDVPHGEDGSSAYAGPYLKTGRAAYDRAVTCSGQVISFKLARPVPDFNQVVALSAFAPVRSDMDRGARSATQIFSPAAMRTPRSTE